MPSPTVLTVEDDAAIRRGIVDALRFAGYGVFEAARGDTGREMALANRTICCCWISCFRVATDSIFCGPSGNFGRRNR